MKGKMNSDIKVGESVIIKEKKVNIKENYRKIGKKKRRGCWYGSTRT